MPEGGQRTGDTRAFFPSREDAERFARQFEGSAYQIQIHPEQRHGREVFQVHVHHGDVRPGPEPDLVRMLGAVGDRARGAGLDGDQLARHMGRALGEAMARRDATAPVERREALARLGTLLSQCGLGGLGVVSVTPLVVRMDPSDRAAAPGGRGCGHIAGVMEGALGALLGEPVAVREMDCIGLGNPYCTFSVRI
ncbi:MAG TPA: V4R domain-containing protein [Candidatus Thermoplasmatota archaeon]|jgi:predicted hydrocarbon binding protein|nr:V4R domain-containing protein [Candidatus Thermoplasmatota archaeon]